MCVFMHKMLALVNNTKIYFWHALMELGVITSQGQNIYIFENIFSLYFTDIFNKTASRAQIARDPPQQLLISIPRRPPSTQRTLRPPEEELLWKVLQNSDTSISSLCASKKGLSGLIRRSVR